VQCPRWLRCCSGTAAEVDVPAGHQPCHLAETPWPATAASRAPRPAHVARVASPRWLPQGPLQCPPWEPARQRRPDTVRTAVRRGQQHGHRHQPGHVCRTPSVRTGSFWTRRTVNPLTGPARYNFLYSSSGRPRPATPLPACHQAIGHAHCCTKSRPPVRMLEV